jgi:hypothetical protein
MHVLLLVIYHIMHHIAFYFVVKTFSEHRVLFKGRNNILYTAFLYRRYSVKGSTIFQLYRGGCFYWCRKPDPPEYPEKTTDLPQVIEGIPIASKVNARNV